MFLNRNLRNMRLVTERKKYTHVVRSFVKQLTIDWRLKEIKTVYCIRINNRVYSLLNHSFYQCSNRKHLIIHELYTVPHLRTCLHDRVYYDLRLYKHNLSACAILFVVPIKLMVAFYEQQKCCFIAPGISTCIRRYSNEVQYLHTS